MFRDGEYHAHGENHVAHVRSQRRSASQDGRIILLSTNIEGLWWNKAARWLEMLPMLPRPNEAVGVP